MFMLLDRMCQRLQNSLTTLNPLAAVMQDRPPAAAWKDTLGGPEGDAGRRTERARGWNERTT